MKLRCEVDAVAFVRKWFSIALNDSNLTHNAIVHAPIPVIPVWLASVIYAYCDDDAS